MAQFRTHYLTKGLSYVSTQKSGQFDTFLIVEYSRMKVPSLSSGCEIAPFFCSLHRSRVNHHVSGYICAETPPPAGDDPTATGT